MTASNDTAGRADLQHCGCCGRNLPAGKVAELGKLAPEIRQKVMKQIALFNFSSTVGTLHVDENTGEVTLRHNVNPRMVPAAAIAQVATQFTNSIVLQSRMLVK